MFRLMLRWALRDLKARWLQVATIALMIAIGTGMFAGLSSLTKWRIASNDASFGLTNMYDLRVQLSGASYLSQGAMAGLAAEVDGVLAAEERLIQQTQVDVEGPTGPVFVPGRIIGVDLSNGGPHVNGIEPYAGRRLDERDSGESVVLLERNFAAFYDLPESGLLRLSGDAQVSFVGHGLSPEYFLVIEQGGFYAQANLAVVFTSIETAQSITGRDGLVNDLVLTIRPGADVDEVAEALEQSLASSFPDTGFSLMRTEDDPSYLTMTKDPEGDQQLYNVLALIIFGGAAFASLNLAARMVEAQRREIGTAMALGVPRRMIAVRPMLIGLEMGVLGVIFGVGVGLLVGTSMQSVLESFVPLPVFVTSFQTGIFAQAAVVGLILPLAATLWPVWRAVRVLPVDAIRTGHLAARGGGLAPSISRLPLPGHSLGRMPFRNLLRAPRTTFLTLFALTAVIGILVAIVGLIDSFILTMERSEQEVLGDAPERVQIDLDFFYPVDSPQVRSLVDGGALASPEYGLRLSGTVRDNGDPIDVLLQFTDFESDLWRPNTSEGELTVGELGIVIAKKAAADLGVSVGDIVTLTHPERTGPASFRLQDTQLPVLAIHPHPLRFNAYMDVRQADLVGLGGTTNVVYGVPSTGNTVDSLKRAVFGAPGVGTVQGVAATAQVTREFIEQFVGIFQVIQLFVLGLALLIAFNTANLSTDERARDHATMFAFGVSVRRVVGILVTEGLLLGIIATALGVGLGYLILRWIVASLFPDVAPDLGVVIGVDYLAMTVVLAAGIAVIAVAPALTVRKLRRMDIPSTLRVLE